MGLEKLGAIGAGIGDKLNENADKALNKARAIEVSTCCRSSPFSATTKRNSAINIKHDVSRFLSMMSTHVD